MNEKYESFIKKKYLGFCPPTFWVKGFEIKWIYKVKIHSNGTLDYLKSCLVSNGYTQTYFLMNKHESIWTIFVFVVIHNMNII
jgi:hypothetical protein